MRCPPVALALVSLMVAASVSAEPSAAHTTEALALTCSTCHWIESSKPGPDTNSGIPTLHGRSAAELLKKLREYRSGVGDPTIMNRIARGYSDEELVRIADFIAAAGASATDPQR
jgi:cytochrome subunit of sulfide dehydrogenase